MTSRALRLSIAAGASEPTFADGTRVVLGGPPPSGGPWAQVRYIPGFTCASAAEIDAVLAQPVHPSRLSLILYDLEGWAFTPARERREPGRFVVAAKSAVFGTSTLLGVAPSLTLAAQLQPGSRSPEQAYFRSGLVAGMAPVVDLYHIQSQRFEREPDRFAEFVRTVRDEVTRLNPDAVVTAGLSANPPGPPVTAGQLLACIDRTGDYVDGYWLNVPRRGPKCPRCRPENPNLAAEVMNCIGASQGKLLAWPSNPG